VNSQLGHGSPKQLVLNATLCRIFGTTGQYLAKRRQGFGNSLFLGGVAWLFYFIKSFGLGAHFTTA